MSALQGIAPLLEPSALWGIAQQLWAARDRLALRTGANIPSASQLLVALRMYISDQDRRRELALPAPCLTPPGGSGSVPDFSAAAASGSGSALAAEAAVTAAAMATIADDVPLAEVGQCVMLAQAAYADNKQQLLEMLELVGDGDEFLLEARWYSSRCHPAYFIAYDPRLKAVVLSVRGSKEVADFITNLSCDTTQFFGGYGHEGVVQSARNLAAVIAPKIFEYIDVHRPENGLLVVGHSLGGAVATLLTMMLRSNALDEHVHFANPPPRRVSSPRASASVTAAADVRRASDIRAQAEVEIDTTAPRPSDAARAIAANVRCFAFGSPPCLSPKVARLARELGVTTFVLGLDMVPRLSAGSLDRLLLAVSRYDWQGELTGNVEENVRGFLSQALGPASGAAAAAVIASVGPNLIGPVVGAIQRSAQSALMAPRERPVRGGAAPAAGMHPAQKIMLGTVAIAAGFLTNQFFHPQQPAAANRRLEGRAGHERQGDYSFAARFGMTPDQVEEALIPNQPEPLHLAGRILHIDRLFTPPVEYRNDETLPAARLVDREPEFFLEVEASNWMLHDHHPPNLAIAMASLGAHNTL